MQIASIRYNLHEMSNPVFLKERERETERERKGKHISKYRLLKISHSVER